MSAQDRPLPITYVRYKVIEDTLSRKFGPKPADHSTIGSPCVACGKEFADGDFTTLVPLGPGGDSEAREKASLGGWISAVAIEIHWACRTGEES